MARHLAKVTKAGALSSMMRSLWVQGSFFAGHAKALSHVVPGWLVAVRSRSRSRSRALKSPCVASQGPARRKERSPSDDGRASEVLRNATRWAHGLDPNRRPAAQVQLEFHASPRDASRRRADSRGLVFLVFKRLEDTSWVARWAAERFSSISRLFRSIPHIAPHAHWRAWMRKRRRELKEESRVL